MSNIMVIIIIALVVLTVFGGICLLIPYLVKRGINISGMLVGTNSALDAAEIVVDGVRTFLPDNPSLCVVERIIDYAQKAVEAAEQMYKTSKIEAAERNAKATEIVYDCLKVAGIEIDDDIKKIVDGLIEAAVFTLPATYPHPVTET